MNYGIKLLGPALAAAILLGLDACGDNKTPPFTGAVRVGNGITDSNGLDMSVANIAAFSGIGVDTASGISDAPEGSYKAQLSSNSIGFTVDGLSVDHNNVTTVFAYGAIGSGTQGGFAAEESIVAPSSGQAVLQAVHAALAASATAPSLNFYFVTPGVCSSAIAGAGPNSTAKFAASTGSFTLSGGSYEICVTDAAGTVLFDSGPKGIALPGSQGNVFQLAAYDAPSGKGSGSSLVLSLLDNGGGNTALYNLAN
jgi:hypothetical protein